MFETQKSGDKTSSGEIGLNIRTLASSKVGQDQVSGGVSVLCLYAAPVANVATDSPKSAFFNDLVGGFFVLMGFFNFVLVYGLLS